MMVMRGNAYTLQFRKGYFMNVWEWHGDESLRVIYHKIVGDGERKGAFQRKGRRGKEQVSLKKKKEKIKKRRNIEVKR